MGCRMPDNLIRQSALPCLWLIVTMALGCGKAREAVTPPIMTHMYMAQVSAGTSNPDYPPGQSHTVVTFSIAETDEQAEEFARQCLEKAGWVDVSNIKHSKVDPTALLHEEEAVRNSVAIARTRGCSVLVY